MHHYNGTHGSLPPPAVYGKDGRPLLSWRVLVLPYPLESRPEKEVRDIAHEYWPRLLELIGAE